jgi:hypothetical protein
VRSFLIEAIVDHDGFGACQYLDGHARDELRAVAPTPYAGCQMTMGQAQLRLGSQDIEQESQVKALASRVRRRGPDVLVTVARSGSVTFVVKRGSRRDLEEFRAPPTPWRIDSGVAVLIPRPAPPGARRSARSGAGSL